MASTITPVSAILAGKINFKLRVRLINLWSIPEFKNPSEESCLHMLFLDEALGKIQATARKDLVNKMKEKIKEGEVYEIENLLVTHNDASFAATTHRFRLNLMSQTRFERVENNAIPMNHFNFVPFPEILDCDREDKLVDIIGHVVEKDPIKENVKNGRKMTLIDMTLEDPDRNRIHVTLWNQYANQFQNFVDSYQASSPIIVILQLGKTSKFYGSMGVSNALYGTKLILNGDLPDVSEYKSRIADKEVQVL